LNAPQGLPTAAHFSNGFLVRKRTKTIRKIEPESGLKAHALFQSVGCAELARRINRE
jgi:hypothetical protein